MATLRELNVQPGDVAGCDVDVSFTVDSVDGKYVCGTTVWAGGEILNDYFWLLDGMYDWYIISRAADKSKTWGEMTDAEKGALLLAKYEGRELEWIDPDAEGDAWDRRGITFWLDKMAYRIKPEPVRVVVSFTGRISTLGPEFAPVNEQYHTHRITFETINDVPDCATIKMEELL